VIHAGGVPVFVDVDPETFLMDLDDAWEKTDEGTCAVVPVHLFGNMVPVDGLLELAEEYDLMIVHDAAQALGSTYMGATIGEFSDVSCYSFYPSKIITTGEGGMVTTNSEEIGHRVELLKNHGEVEKYRHTSLGYNYRGNEVSSVLGLDQMTRLDYFLEKRRSIARYYDLAVGNIEGISPQLVTEGTESCYNYYTVKVEPDMGLDRDRIVEDMRNMNIETIVHYPYALTEQPALMKYVTEPCPVAEEIARNVFSIPIHPYLTEKEAEQVVLALRTVVYRYL
jgi:perosamine synthetase